MIIQTHFTGNIDISQTIRLQNSTTNTLTVLCEIFVPYLLNHPLLKLTQALHWNHHRNTSKVYGHARVRFYILPGWPPSCVKELFILYRRHAQNILGSRVFRS